MRKALKTIVLTLVASLMASGAVLADTNPWNVIVVDPGETVFTLAGEDFLVVTGKRIRLVFDGISPERVYGSIEAMDGFSDQPVKLVWTSAGHCPLTLHNRVLQYKTTQFDSDVTGHNEKSR